MWPSSSWRLQLCFALFYIINKNEPSATLEAIFPSRPPFVTVSPFLLFW